MEMQQQGTGIPSKHEVPTDKPRFSVFDTYVYGFKTFLDNIRLFVLAALAKLATFLGLFMLFGIFAAGLIKSLVVLLPQFKAFMNCTNHIECMAIFQQQVWPNLSSIISRYSIWFILFGLLFVFVGIAIWLGFIRLVLKLHDTGKSSVKLLFSAFDVAPKGLIASILYGLMVFGGSLLFIIPGIYLGLRFGFYTFFIADKNAGIIDSLKRSWDATRNHGWQLFGVALLIPILMAVPILIFFVAPIITAAWVYVYRKLTA